MTLRPRNGRALGGFRGRIGMLDRMDDSLVDVRQGRRDGPSPDHLVQVVRLAARLAQAPVALLGGGSARAAWSDPSLRLLPGQLERLQDICSHLDGAPAAAVIPDATQDPRLWHSPSVAGAPHVRFVAAMPLTGPKGEGLGVLCVMDTKPRAQLADAHADLLSDLAALAARIVERERDSETQRRTQRGRARSEQIEAAVGRAPTCELALAGMLVSLCKHHTATAGFVGKLSGGGAMQEVCHYNDESALGDYFARTASLAATPESSHAVMAIQTGTARTLQFTGTETQAAFPGIAEAIRLGLRAQVIQPVHVLDEKFGIVMMFDTPRPDLEVVSDDVGGVLRQVRPALYRKAAERRMGLLGTALDRANDAVLITEAGPLGAGGPKIVYANASFCRESGFALHEVLGQPHGMLHGPNTDQAALAQLRQEMRRWKSARAELLHRRRDGSEYWAEVDLTPITDEAGLPTHWISIQRDVTQRRQAEAERRRHEASFRLLFSDNPLPMVVLDRGSQRFIEVNDAAVAQYGWPREEFLARSLSDLSPDWAAGPLDASTTHVRDDGSVLEVRSFVHDTVYAGQDATLAVLWDVTDLEAARRDMGHANEMLRERTLQLHARTEELAEAQRLARLGTWRMSVDRRDVSWSREMFELMGLPRDAAGPDADDLVQRIHPDDRAAVQAALTAAARDARAQNFEYRVSLPDDQVRHLRAQVRPILDASGEVVELFGYSQDISENKRAEHALLRNESLRALGQLTGGVAHDFNNLLTVVILNLEEAQDTLPEHHSLQEVLKPALHAAVRGAELTSQLLSYARRATLRPEKSAAGRVLRRPPPAAEPGAGRAVRAAGAAASQRRQRDGRPGAARQRHHEPGHQRPRRDGVGRDDRAGDALGDPARGLAGVPGRGDARPLRGHQRRRPRHGHPRAPAAARVRAVLHHQGGRQGQRHGAQHGLRLRPAVRRARDHRQQARPGHDRAPVPAGRGRTGGRGAGRHGRPRGVERPRPARAGGRGSGQRAAHRHAHAGGVGVRRDLGHLRRRCAVASGRRAAVRRAVQRHRPAGHHGWGGIGGRGARPLAGHAHPADLGVHRAPDRGAGDDGTGRGLPDETVQAPGSADEAERDVPAPGVTGQ